MQKVRPLSMPSRIVLTLVTASLALGTLTSCGGDDPPNGTGSPEAVVSVNGNYFKSPMGLGTFDRQLLLAVTDDGGNRLPSQQIQLDPLDGDGALSHRSVTTGANGTATFGYIFDGVRGDAIVRAYVEDIDTIDIFLRANTLIPGAGGQGQYILFTDRFRDILDFNGQPASIDIFPSNPEQQHTAYINYEQALGFIPVVYRETIETVPHDDRKSTV